MKPPLIPAKKAPGKSEKLKIFQLAVVLSSEWPHGQREPSEEVGEYLLAYDSQKVKLIQQRSYDA